MMSPDDPSTAVLETRLGDLSRRFDEYRADTMKRFDGLNNHIERQFANVVHQIEAQSYVPRSIFDLTIAANERRISAMEKIMEARDVEERRQRRETRAALVTSLIYPTVVAIIILVVQLALR